MARGLGESKCNVGTGQQQEIYIFKNMAKQQENKNIEKTQMSKLIQCSNDDGFSHHKARARQGCVLKSF